jgi:ketosteroid isomerase-like protein
MMAEQTGDHVSDLIRKSYQAFLSRDKKTMADLLSDDFVFTSPQDDHRDKSAYFKICFPNSGEFRSHHIEQLFVHGGEALVRYQAELKDGTRFRNVEYFQIDGNKIKAVEVYFGAAITPARDREDKK